MCTLEPPKSACLEKNAQQNFAHYSRKSQTFMSHAVYVKILLSSGSILAKNLSNVNCFFLRCITLWKWETTLSFIGFNTLSVSYVGALLLKEILTLIPFFHNGLYHITAKLLPLPQWNAPQQVPSAAHSGVQQVLLSSLAGPWAAEEVSCWGGGEELDLYEVVLSIHIIHQGWSVCRGIVHQKAAPFRQLVVKKIFLNDRHLHSHTAEGSVCPSCPCVLVSQQCLFLLRDVGSVWHLPEEPRFIAVEHLLSNVCLHEFHEFFPEGFCSSFVRTGSLTMSYRTVDATSFAEFIKQPSTGFKFNTCCTCRGMDDRTENSCRLRNSSIYCLFSYKENMFRTFQHHHNAQQHNTVFSTTINNLRYADDTTLMAESEEELKSRLMRMKEESAKVGLKLNIKKTKIMASGPLTSWQIDGEEMEVVTDFIFLGTKITADGDCSQEIKRRLLLGKKAMANLDSILKIKTSPCQRKPDSEDESQILWPLNEKERLAGEEPNVGNNRWQKKKGTAEDEVARWSH
ncbi:putative uncharacterized transposon-derived protein F52C9.6 [Varanus komodoensis]|nr:putative uncharacterized transposon-derived protein F52C9.6 [Varanus komodoensis]